MTKTTTQIIAENQEHEQCKLCGAPRVEIHHITPKRMGGSADADRPENLIALCPKHHRLVTEEKIKLEFIEEDGNEWIIVRGENREIIAVRPRNETKPDIAGKLIHKIRTASQTVLSDIPLLGDEVLKQMFSIAMEMSHSAFAIECEIAYTLFSRVIGTYEEKIEAIAQYLGITKTTAYHRVRCRDVFGRGIPPLASIPDVKPSHLMIAAATKRPQEALEVLTEMMNERYVTTAEFKETIDRLRKQWREEDASGENSVNRENGENAETQTSARKAGQTPLQTSEEPPHGTGTCPHAVTVTFCALHSRIVKLVHPRDCAGPRKRGRPPKKRPEIPADDSGEAHRDSGD